ncbi:hypothetical protein MMC21_007754 [Puttea exsequens]|nr:hypothetical protein [Puttea exsequens]
MAYSPITGEDKNLLDESGDPSLDSGSLLHRSHFSALRKRLHSQLYMPWVLHLAVLLLYSVIFASIAWKFMTQHLHGPGLIFSPARDAVDFERVRFDGSFIIESPFTGAPRPEQDSAWHDLLQSM